MKKKLLSLILTLSLLLALAAPALAATTAATIKLSKTSGTVSVSKSSGKALTLMRDMRLYNGYHVATAASSYAWMNLDDTKLIKEDVSSEVEVRKSGNNLEVYICSGNVFFNVTEKLSDNESLNISTSTMIVGIRGTAGYVQVRDRWTTDVTILEGAVQCTVTDPVTGQTKTQVIRGGQTATCVVYPQERPGEKCDILMEQETQPVTEIPGFVLTDVVRDMELCERIEENTGTDILEELATVVGGDPSGRSEDGTSASPEILGEADRRETTQAEQRQEAQEAAEEQAEEEQPESIAPDKALMHEEETPSTGGGSTGGDTGSTPAPTSTTVTMPLTVPEIQALLGQYETVNVQASGGPAGADTLAITDVDTLTVAAGKTLNLEAGVNLEVASAGTLDVAGILNPNELENYGTVTIDGTVNPFGLNNYGSLTVNSADTLHVTGDFTNEGTLEVTATGRVVVDGTFTSKGTLTLKAGAQVLAGTFDQGITYPSANWNPSLDQADGSHYRLLYTDIYTITFDANGGKFEDGATSKTAQTAITGRLTTNSMPSIDSSEIQDTGRTFGFEGWYTDIDGWERITEETQFSGDTTVYARWSDMGWKLGQSGEYVTMTIHGSSAMPDYDDTFPPPWRNTIATQNVSFISLFGTITHIGANAFAEQSSLTSVDIPNTVTSIGAGAFAGCTGISIIHVPDTVTSIGALAFDKLSETTAPRIFLAGGAEQYRALGLEENHDAYGANLTYVDSEGNSLEPVQP